MLMREKMQTAYSYFSAHHPHEQATKLVVSAQTYCQILTEAELGELQFKKNMAVYMGLELVVTRDDNIFEMQ